MAALVVIPARGGSKGLPDKNLAKIKDETLVAWAIAAIPPKVPCILSSDSEAILDLAVYPHVSPMHRGKGHAEDWSHDLQTAQEIINPDLSGIVLQPDDFLVWLRPTSPFREPPDVAAIIEYMDAHPEIDSLRSVVPAKEHPAKMYRISGDLGDGIDWLAPWDGPHRANHPRQLLPPAFRACGWIDAIRVRCIRDHSMEGFVIGAWRPPYPDVRALEIDDEDDLVLAKETAHKRVWRPGKCS